MPRILGSSVSVITTILSTSTSTSTSLRPRQHHRHSRRRRLRRFCSITTMLLSLIVSLMAYCCVAIEQPPPQQQQQQQQQQQTSETITPTYLNVNLNLDDRRRQQLDDGFGSYETYINFGGFARPRGNNDGNNGPAGSFRVPDTYNKLRDSDSERGSDISAYLPEEEEEPEVIVEVEKDDDDYSVTILDDEVPWTDDSPSEDEGEDDESRPLFDEAEMFLDSNERQQGTSYPFLDEAMIFEEEASIYPDTDTDPPKPTSPPTVEDILEVLLILEDDVPWDDIVNADIIDELASNASQALNALLDNVETIEPTTTLYPTIPPTKEPTLSPTRSSQPTLPATDQPSFLPSDYPSMMPTDQPSFVPTISPTQLCHDYENYQSPINNLTCAAHTNTNCLSWRYLGLNMTQLKDLVDSCPQTCNIECNSFSLFNAPVSFRISRVSGFMDTSDVDSLSDFALQYVEDFVREYIGSGGAVGNNNDDDEQRQQQQSNEDLTTTGNNNNNAVDDEITGGGGGDGGDDDSFEYKDEQDDFLNDDVVVGDILMFEIENIVLTSQTLVEDIESDSDAADVDVNVVVATGRNNNRLLRSRGGTSSDEEASSSSLSDLKRLKQQSSGSGSSIIQTDQALDVIITFEGFTIGMKPDTMSELIVLGIDSIDFTRELQRSSNGDFFMYVPTNC
jgi:hypothetical protein